LSTPSIFVIGAKSNVDALGGQMRYLVPAVVECRSLNALPNRCVGVETTLWTALVDAFWLSYVVSVR